MVLGLLRLILALTVVATHGFTISGWTGVGGKLAVQLFYVISGFLITIVLDQKYKGPNHLFLFYSNRILRVWAPYILVALATVIAMKVSARLLSGHELGGSGIFTRSALYSFDWKTSLAVFTTNIFLIGQDIGMLFAYDPARGGLYFTPNFNNEKTPLYQFYIMDQSWTLGIEVTFYLIAPFLVTRRWYIVAAVLALSLAARFYTYAAGFDFDPWTYRFFPFELAFFLVGALAGKLYLTQVRPMTAMGVAGKLVACVAVATVCVWGFLPSWFRSEFLLFGLTAGALPFLFKWTKNWDYDRFLGALSYPIYLVHIPVTLVFRSLIPDRPWEIFLIPVSVGLAILLAIFVEFPLDRMRQRRVQQTLTREEALPASAKA